MSTWLIVVLLVCGIALALVSFIARTRSKDYEVKTSDLVLVIIPLLLVALATGKVQGLDLFGVKADLSALWVKAASTQIQVARTEPLSVKDVLDASGLAMKGDLVRLQTLLAQPKVDALGFRLGQFYSGPAIREYFQKLSGNSRLRAVVVQQPDGTLFGMYQAADIISYLNVAGEAAYSRFQHDLTSGDEAARAELAKLPGFVAAKDAITTSASKRDALARMTQLDVSLLPVADEHERFVGTVDRSKVTANLILAVTEKVESR